MNAESSAKGLLVNIKLPQCAIETCAECNPKGLYAQAEQGEIKTLVGVNGEYAAPENPGIVLHTESESVSVLVDRL